MSNEIVMLAKIVLILFLIVGILGLIFIIGGLLFFTISCIKDWIEDLFL